MADIIFITAVGQVAIPVAFIIWLWLGRCGGRGEWLLKSLAGAAYLALIAVVGVWLLVPWYLPYVYAVGGVGAAAASWRRVNRFPLRQESRLKTGFRRGSVMLIAVFCASGIGHAVRGYSPPEGLSACISFPLINGTFYVVNAGYSILINPHMKTLRAELAHYKGQSYALDIVQLDQFGLRAMGLWPREPERYHIFGAPVQAPCEGVVAGIEKRLPDLKPPEQDRQNPAGNFVLIECGETQVLLAHLMQESLSVDSGERVQEGQFIGRVGNSGYSTEPHLHLHAQRRSTGENFFSADPLPLQIDGRILVRNSRIVSK